MNACITKGMSLLLLPLAVGCLKIPSGDIAASEAAMSAAVAAEAPEYAPEAWIAAQNAQSELEIELLAQREASLLSRSYRHAKTQAAAVRVAAEQAVVEAQSRKTLAREEAARAIEGAKALYKEVSKLAGDASQSDGVAAPEDPEHAALLEEADHALLEGHYSLAREKAEEVLQSLNRAKKQSRGALSEDPA